MIARHALQTCARHPLVLFGFLTAFAANAAAQTSSLALSGASGPPGSTITLAVSINVAGSTPPTAVQWDLTYSSSVLSLVSGSFYATGAASSGAGKSVTCNPISATDVRCIVSGINTTAIGSGVLASLTFKIASGATETSTAVSFSSPCASSGSANAVAITATGGTVVITGAGTPTVVSVTPNSGSGASQTFALQYSDTAGAANLQAAYVWFSANLTTPTSSCMLYYQPSTNQLNLLNNAATAWQAATPGASTTLQNSQCSVNMAATTVTLNGNTLTLNLAMTFQTGYAGAKNVYMFAMDLSGSNSGWQQEGTWTVPSGSGTPAVVAVTPTSGSGDSQTFQLQYSDTAGAANLQAAYVWFNANLTTTTSSCMLYYQPSTNQLNLLNNAATAWQAATPGASTTLQNSQCSVNMAATTVTLNGNTLTLNLAMTFQPGYAGAKNVYMFAIDASGSNSGWQQMGTWTVP